MPGTPGNTFQTARAIDRGMSVDDVAYGIVNASSVRRFERDETSPYLATVIPLLERLRITPSEFFAKQNNFSPTKVASFYETVTAAYNRQDYFALQRLLEKQKKPYPHEPVNLPFHRLDSITIKSAMGMLHDEPLSSDDVSFVMAYLHSQRNWFFYDLNMLRYLHAFLSGSDLSWISQNLFSRSASYIRVLNNTDLVSDIILNVATILITSTNEYDEAMNLLVLSHRADVMQEKLEFSMHRKVLEAALEFRRGDRVHATKVHDQILATLDLLDADQNIQLVESLWPLLTQTRKA